MELLPQLEPRWQQRSRRPLATSVQFAREHFKRVWIADSSTQALFRKLESLGQDLAGTLAGKMATVVDLTRLPVHIWFEEKASASDTHFEADLLSVLAAQTLLIMDGASHFSSGHN